MIRLHRALLVLFVLASMAAPAAAQDKVANLTKKVEALEAEVAKLAAESPTVTSSVTDLTGRVEQLSTALDTLKRQQQSVPQAIESLDKLEQVLGEVRSDLEELRTRIGSLEAPEEFSGGGGGGVRYKDGFRWSTANGKYRLRLRGLMQFRVQASVAENDNGAFDDEAGSMLFRRTRLLVDAGVSRFNIHLMIDPRLDQSLVDFWAQGTVYKNDWLKLGLRFGQYRSVFSRSFITWGRDYVFLERPQAVDDLRYDRSPGLGVEAELLDNQLYAYAGVSNGSGAGLNDNIELASFFRLEASVFGPRPAYSYGDLEHSKSPVLVLGAGFVHDLAQVPETVSGIEVAERDVDGDGELDDVRIVSVSADILFRYRGFELAAEGIYRREDWGTIFDQADNTDIGALFEFDGERNYLGFYGDVSYALDHWVFGGRFGHHRQTPLYTDGRSRGAAPLSKRLLEATGVARMMLPGGWRYMGVQYTYLNNNNKDDPEVPNDEEHRVTVGLQMQF